MNTIVDTDKLEAERARVIRKRRSEDTICTVILLACVVAFCYLCAIA